MLACVSLLRTVFYVVFVCEHVSFSVLLTRFQDRKRVALRSVSSTCELLLRGRFNALNET